MAQTWKRMPTQPTRSYQDEDKVVNGVKDIIKWGSGQTEDFDPVMMAKISQSLNVVDDYAHWVSQEEINDKYNSIPFPVIVSLKKASQWVNAKGSMTNYELTSQAKNYGVKLSDQEKQLLQKRPWIQQSYLEVKKKSANIDSSQMEAIMGTILNDIQTWLIPDKEHLQVRLQNALNMSNLADVDYLAEDLWSDFTANKTNNEKLQRIRTKYKELFWFEDRTNKQKAKEGWLWLLNGLEEKVVNWLHWLTESATDLMYGTTRLVGKIGWADENPENRIPADVDLWGIDENALSPETRDMVEKIRAYGLWAWVVSAMDVYWDAIEETTDAKIDEVFRDKTFPYKEDSKDSEMLRENSNYVSVWEFVWGAIPEIYITSKIGALLPMSVVKNAPWYLRLWYKILRSWLEWVAFSAMEEWELDKTEVGVYTASSVLLDPFFSTIWNKLSKRWIKKYFWKGWNGAVEDVMNYGEKNALKNAESKALTNAEEKAVTQVAWDIANKWVKVTREDAEKYIVETVAEKLPNEFVLTTASNTLDTASKYIDDAVTGIQWDITSSLSKIGDKYENKHIFNMLKEVFWQTDKEVSEAYAIFKNARVWAGISEEVVDKEWNMMMDLYLEWGNKFTLAEQEQIKRNMRTIANTYNSSNKPLTWRLPQWWRNEQISAQNVLKWYAEENWIKNLWDLYLQESVLIRASEWFSQNAPKDMMDIINRYAWRTLVWWIGGYVASQTIWDWPLSNPYIATATTILVMALWWSPRVSLSVSKFANRMSVIEARAIINSAEDGTLPKLDKYTFEWATEHLKDVLYADSLERLINDIEWHNNSDFSYYQWGEQELDAWIMGAIRQQYGMY